MTDAVSEFLDAMGAASIHPLVPTIKLVADDAGQPILSFRLWNLLNICLHFCKLVLRSKLIAVVGELAENIVLTSTRNGSGPGGASRTLGSETLAACVGVDIAHRSLAELPGDIAQHVCKAGNERPVGSRGF